MTAATQPALSFAALMLQRFAGRSTGYLKRRLKADAQGKKYWTEKAPLTEAVFEDHLNGKQPIGVFLLPEGGKHVRFAAIDLDDHEGALGWPEMARRAALIRDQLRRFGEPLAVRSGGGHGIHLYVFFATPTPAAGARGFLGRLVKAAGFEEQSGSVEIFPKQEGGNGFGNAIGLPFSRQGVPLDDDFNPLPMSEARARLEATPDFDTIGMGEPEAAPEEVIDLEREREKRGRKRNPSLDWRKGVTGAPVGQRDEYLYKLACRLRHDAVPEDEAKGIMIEAAAKCEPPADTKNALDKLYRAYRDHKEGPGSGSDFKQAPPSQVDVLVELAQGAEVWRTKHGAFFATVTEADHKEHHPLASVSFRRWLTREYSNNVGGKVPGQQAMADAIFAVEALMHTAPVLEPARRVGAHNGKLYVDLCDDQWRAVEIDAQGWRVVPQPPVRFLRDTGMLPLPVPVEGGSVQELRPFINTGEAGFRLLVAVLLSHLRPTGPFPILAIHGEHGTAKSSTTRFVRALTDPHEADLRRPPREDRDLIAAANKTWVLAFDNLSAVPQWMSDSFCMLATGGAYTARTMRTDHDETILTGLNRPLVLNGIDDIDRYADLMSRTVRVVLDPIPEESRKTEDELKTAFEAARPRLTGALYTAVSAALRNAPTTKMARLPRMADFAKWVTAAEDGLGWQPGDFMRAFDENQETATLDALAGDTVAQSIVGLVNLRAGDLPPSAKRTVWEGSTGDLLNDLKGFVTDDIRNSKFWPANATGLSKRLRKLAPGLRTAGVNLDLGHRDGNNRSLVLIYKIEEPRIEGRTIGGGLPSEGAVSAF